MVDDLNQYHTQYRAVIVAAAAKKGFLLVITERVVQMEWYLLPSAPGHRRVNIRRSRPNPSGPVGTS